MMNNASVAEWLKANDSKSFLYGFDSCRKHKFIKMFGFFVTFL